MLKPAVNKIEGSKKLSVVSSKFIELGPPTESKSKNSCEPSVVACRIN